MIIELTSNDCNVMIQWYNDMMIMWYNDDNMMIAIEKQPKTLKWVIPPTKGPFELKSQYIYSQQPTSQTKKWCKKKQFRLMARWLYLSSTFHSTIGWFIPVGCCRAPRMLLDWIQHPRHVQAPYCHSQATREEDFLFCLSLWLCAGGGFADPLFS